MAPTLSDPAPAPAPALHLAGPSGNKIMVTVYASGKSVPTTPDLLTLKPNVNYEFSYPLSDAEVAAANRPYLTLSNSLDGTGPVIGENIYSQSAEVVTYNNTNNINWGGMEYRPYRGSMVPHANCRSTLFKKIAEGIDTNGNPTPSCDPTKPMILTVWMFNNDGSRVILKQSYLSFAPPLTPLFLGKAETDADGNFAFNDAIVTSDATDMQGNQLINAEWANLHYAKASDFTAASATILGNFNSLVNETDNLRQVVAALVGNLYGLDISTGFSLVGSQAGETVSYVVPPVQALQLRPDGNIGPATQAP